MSLRGRAAETSCAGRTRNRQTRLLPARTGAGTRSWRAPGTGKCILGLRAEAADSSMVLRPGANRRARRPCCPAESEARSADIRSTCRPSPGGPRRSACTRTPGSASGERLGWMRSALSTTAAYWTPAAADYMVRTLAERWDLIARQWFDEVVPLDFFTVEDIRLNWHDLGALPGGHGPGERGTPRSGRLRRVAGVDRTDLRSAGGRGGAAVAAAPATRSSASSTSSPWWSRARLVAHCSSC